MNSKTTMKKKAIMKFEKATQHNSDRSLLKVSVLC